MFGIFVHLHIPHTLSVHSREFRAPKVTIAERISASFGCNQFERKSRQKVLRENVLGHSTFVWREFVMIQDFQSKQQLFPYKMHEIFFDSENVRFT
jgi:hypothetical protein